MLPFIWCRLTFTITEFSSFSSCKWLSLISTPMSFAKLGALIRFKPFFVRSVRTPTRTAVWINFFVSIPAPTVWLSTVAFGFFFKNLPISWPSFFERLIHGVLSSDIAAVKVGALTIPVTLYFVDFPESAKNCCAISTATRCWASAVLAPEIKL